MSSSLEAFARQKLSVLESQDALRSLRTGTGDARSFRFGGRVFVAFASNDYLGLAHHPEVLAAAHRSLDEVGAGATASRLVVGDHPEYTSLEGALAALKGTEKACVFGSGYHANLGVVPALMGPEDIVFLDALAHACLYSGARLSRAKIVSFPHNDAAALETLLAKERRSGRRAMVLTEGVFSMDGDLAPLSELAALCDRFDAWLLVDDAHATGVIGPNGAGSTAAAGLAASRIPLQVGTLSKALGGYGGFLCAARPVVDLMITRARTFIYSTGLPPPVVAAGRRALEIVRREPERRDRVREYAARVTEALGLPSVPAAIIPIPLGTNQKVMDVHRRLLERGLWVPAMRPPTVPEGTARLRVSLSAAHTEADIELLISALYDEGLAQ